MKTGYEVNGVRKKYGGLHIGVGLEETILVYFGDKVLRVTYIGENADGLQGFSFNGPKDFKIVSPNLAKKVNPKTWAQE